MTQATPHLSLNGSRLVRFLHNLAISDSEPSPADFSERFARLFDFNNSVSLASLHSDLPTLEYEPLDFTDDEIQAELLRVRKSMVQAILKSFMPAANDGVLRLRFPLPKPAVGEEPLVFDPYRRFYASHQRDMEREVTHLQSYIRDAVGGRSKRLAQLVALDMAMGEALLSHRRKQFAALPGILEPRFVSLQSDENDNWLTQFKQDMQELLLAELEVRLQPVLGLVEALTEDEENE